MRDLGGLELEVSETRALPAARRAALLRLFQRSYRLASADFLDASLATLRNVAVASAEGVPVGFALAETRVMNLPRLPQQLVTLAGISCIDPAYRRRGLFLELERLAARLPAAVETSAAPAGVRHLLCGRMAHPAAFRSLAQRPGAVPRPGARPTSWQQAVGRAIAAVYGARAFDAETFVCIGSGTPIGYPRIALEVEPAEWEVFRPVDRERGDALLGLAWHPESPPGWSGPD